VKLRRFRCEFKLLLYLANYITLKSISPKKHMSPYLDKFTLYGKSWRENEQIKLHNVNVKIQRKRQKCLENMINERKRQQVKFSKIVGKPSYIIMIMST